MFGRMKQPKRVFVLVDWENILVNMNLPPAERFSLASGFDRILKKIAEEVGEIVNVFVFVPSHLALTWGEEFHRLGLFVVLCPKVRDKKTGEEQDTVDQTLIDFGRKAIAQTRELTHLCLFSGDKDFGPFLREAIQKRLKIIIASGNLTSLSGELIGLADRKPSGGKMVYLFSPTGEE